MILPCSLAATSRTTPVTKRVLILSEMGLVAPATNAVIQQLHTTLQRTSPYQLELYLENLETTLFTDDAAQQELRNWYGHKYKNRKIDVIVAIGPEPLRFLTASGSEFFQNIPVVFCCSFEGQPGTLALPSNFTGTWIEVDVPKTIDAALKLLPETQRIVVVGGSSSYDKGVEKEVARELDPYGKRFEIQYLTDLSMDETIKQVKTLPASAVVLFTSFWQDATGRHYNNASVALPMIADESSVPIFGVSDTYLGRGVVGGYSIQFSDQGIVVGNIVNRILGGEDPADIPIIDVPSKFMFDSQLLRKWHLKERNLPQGSFVVNRQPSFFELYQGRVITATLLILSLAAFTCYLAWHIRRRRRAELELRELTGRLINVQEEERLRIARDIHDDINQRLAMLAVGLESTSQQFGSGSEELRSKLNDMWESASQIGIDLHNLSHDLHSSTLENLGLVTGISSFCREFSEATGIQVMFNEPNVPVFPLQISLCLFRVVQEALQNVRKHSGSPSAEINLEFANDVILLSVSDLGTGFSSKRGMGKSGLGIRSMKERLRSIGGALKVRTGAGHGTRIEVRVPYKPTQAADGTLPWPYGELDEFRKARARGRSSSHSVSR